MNEALVLAKAEEQHAEGMASRKDFSPESDDPAYAGSRLVFRGSHPEGGDHDF